MSDHHQSRRSFIKTSTKAGVALTAGSVAGVSVLESFSTANEPNGSSPLATPFAQQALPYTYASLEPYIDAKTMEIHFTKHAATYLTNLKEAAQAEGVDTSKPVEDVLSKISKYTPKMRNNAGGHFNHEFFWKSMKPQGEGKPSGKLSSSIDASFKSFTDFKTQFSDAAKSRFGSGWAWLYIGSDKKLKIGSSPNQDNPLMDISDIKGVPLLGLDVWEHAYYLKYQNKRADYIDNWWNTVNWSMVQSRFESNA